MKPSPLPVSGHRRGAGISKLSTQSARGSESLDVRDQVLPPHKGRLLKPAGELWSIFRLSDAGLSLLESSSLRGNIEIPYRKRRGGGRLPLKRLKQLIGPLVLQRQVKRMY